MRDGGVLRGRARVACLQVLRWDRKMSLFDRQVERVICMENLDRDAVAKELRFR